jgi:hypothetical protein
MDITNALFKHAMFVELQEVYSYDSGVDLTIPKVSPMEFFPAGMR